MDLTIIIPSEGLRSELDALLGSLAAQTFRGSFEILLVGNEYRRELEELELLWRPKLPQLALFFTRSRGVNTARNAGLAKAQGNVVFFLDDDCVLPRADFLADLMAWHQQHPKVGAVGGPYRLPAHSGLWARAYQQNALSWMEEVGRTVSSPRLVGGNLSFKKEFLNQGAWRFSEAIRFGGAETELLQRMVNAGHELALVPTLSVDHHLRMTPFAFFRKAFLQGYALGRREIQGLEPRRPYRGSEEKGFFLSLYRRAFAWGVDWAYEHRPDLGFASSPGRFLVGKVLRRNVWLAWRSEIYAGLAQARREFKAIQKTKASTHK